jgi:hypothetical protein
MGGGWEGDGREGWEGYRRRSLLLGISPGSGLPTIILDYYYLP